jgi:hypothetical protein
MKKFAFLLKEKVGHQVSSKYEAIRPKKTFMLCIHDEYGTKALANPAVILKSTTLQREIKLRRERRKLLWLYRVHNMRTWAAFEENAKTMAQLHLTMDNAIDKYTNRRLQAGLFYVMADTHDFTFTVRSHLYGDNELFADQWRKEDIGA